MTTHEPRPSEECKQVFAALSEFLDLELSPASCEELAAHLEGCPSCIQFLETLRKSISLCRQFSPEEMPEPLNQNARQALQEAYRKMLRAREDSSG